MKENEQTIDVVPVYMSFATFKSAVQTLRDHGLPPKVDRSALGTRSGADQSQIMSGFKFLGLIDQNDTTQESLRKLHGCQQGSEEEKKVLGEILRCRYTKVFELDLETATPRMLADAIGSYGATGSTKDRAIRFFLKAAEYSGIKLSGHLTHGTRSRGEVADTTPTNGKPNNGAAPPKQRRRKRATISGPNLEQRPGSASELALLRTVSLPNVKGTLTLSGNFNAFHLRDDERDLVYQIIDKMNEYEAKTKKESE